MNKRAWVAGLVAFWSAPVAFGAVKVVSEKSKAPSAAFAFEALPAPSRTDAGNSAKFSVVAGTRDRNGGDVGVLNDGRGQTSEDEPARSFFFGAGTSGGRIVAELGEATELKGVHTYSWHPAGRGPQVYKLYGADGAAANFDAKPGEGTDPANVGWKLIANVDTRKEGAAGGQYGVKVADDAGGTLGKFKYVLFDVARTDDADQFSNTFFGEIDLIDGKEHPAPAMAAATGAVSEVFKFGDKYEVTFDYTATPDLKEWVDTKLKPVCVEWYPKIVLMLPSDGYEAPLKFSIRFEDPGRGVAAAGGTRITAAAPWFRKNLEGEALGALVHEMVHVVQQYRRARGGNANPSWLVEGVADYVRWHIYEPAEKRRRLNPARIKYTDSYHVTGAFLGFIEKSNEGFVRKLNGAMREGKYSAEFWKEQTGKTVDELWEEFLKTLQTP